MRRRLANLPLLACALPTILACVTINVYFPEAAVKDLSKVIEEQVEKQAANIETSTPETKPTEPEDSKQEGGRSSLLDSLLAVTPVSAAEAVPEAEVTSPAIRKIIDSRAARIAVLGPYKASGVIGENSQALLEVRDLESLSDLRARAEVQRLVKAENTDREELFREIAAAKNVDLSQLSKIKATYASTLRENAKPGEWIQMPDGAWKKK